MATSPSRSRVPRPLCSLLALGSLAVVASAKGTQGNLQTGLYISDSSKYFQDFQQEMQDQDLGCFQCISFFLKPEFPSGAAQKYQWSRQVKIQPLISDCCSPLTIKSKLYVVLRGDNLLSFPSNGARMLALRSLAVVVSAKGTQGNLQTSLQNLRIQPFLSPVRALSKERSLPIEWVSSHLRVGLYEVQSQNDEMVNGKPVCLS